MAAAGTNRTPQQTSGTSERHVQLSGWSPIDGTSIQSQRADLQVKSAEINFLIRDPSGNNHKVVLMRLSVITSPPLKNVLSRWVFVC